MEPRTLGLSVSAQEMYQRWREGVNPAVSSDA